MDPEKNKFERLIFPTRYVIPKSLVSLAIGQVSSRFLVPEMKHPTFFFENGKGNRPGIDEETPTH